MPTSSWSPIDRVTACLLKNEPASNGMGQLNPEQGEAKRKRV